MAESLIWNPTIQTISGLEFNFEQPDLNSIIIKDIAHALSMQCRFAGHCLKYYCVADHSIRVADYIFNKSRDKLLSLTALLHDSAEAYISDIPSPLKQRLPDFKKIENIVERAIVNKFGLIFPFPPIIKEVDLIMLATEQRYLMKKCNMVWNNVAGKALDTRIYPLTQKQANRLFLAKFKQYS